MSSLFFGDQARFHITYTYLYAAISIKKNQSKEKELSNLLNDNEIEVFRDVSKYIGTYIYLLRFTAYCVLYFT